MARKSAAALSIAGSITDSRLPVPVGFSEAEEVLWRDTLDSKPSTWFAADSAPLLKEYVRAVVTCDVLDIRVKEAMAGRGGVGKTKALLDMRDKEAKRAAALATKLRLTQQSRYTPQSAATADKRASGKRPWQTGS